MNKKKLILIGSVVTIVLLVAVLVLTSGSLLRAGVERGASAALGVKTTLDSASVSLFSGHVALNGLTIANPEGFGTPHAAKVRQIEAAAGLGSLLGNPVRIELIQVQSPELTIEMTSRGTNLGTLLDRLSPPPSTTAPPAQPSPPTGEQKPGKGLVIRVVRINSPRVTLSPFLGGKTLTLNSIELKDVGAGKPGEATDMAGVLRESFGAIMAAVSQHQDIPANIGRMLQQEISIPSLDHVVDSVSKSLDQVDLGTLPKGIEKAGQNLQESVEGLFKKPGKKDER